MTSYRTKTQRINGRKFEYLRHNPSAKKELLLIVGGGAVSGAIVGGVAGAIIGGACGSPGGPPGMALGAGIGAPIGAVIGGAVGTAIAIIELRPRYKEWCKTEAGREFAGNLSVFLNEDRMLEHFKCSICYMPVMQGVRTPDGRLYERSEIEEWIRKNGTNPYTQEPLTIHQLTPDENVSLESAKVFVRFLQEKREETRESAPQLIEGYDTLIQDIRESALKEHNKKVNILQKRWQEGRVSYEDMSRQTRELGETYLNI
jgi:hypothetical protein